MAPITPGSPCGGGAANNLKASPLPPAPLAVAGLLVAGLVAWQYSDWLAGLLFFFWLVSVLLVISVGMFSSSLVSRC